MILADFWEGKHKHIHKYYIINIHTYNHSHNTNFIQQVETGAESIQPSEYKHYLMEIIKVYTTQKKKLKSKVIRLKYLLQRDMCNHKIKSLCILKTMLVQTTIKIIFKTILICYSNIINIWNID